MLRDESKIGLHAALTPTWSETAQLRRLRAADGPWPPSGTTSRARRRTPAKWISFRQPVLRVARERDGRDVRASPTRRTPGEVWEEDEFWIELSLAHRPGRLARHPQALRVARTARARRSPSTSTTAGSSRTRCPACRRRRRARGSTPLEYMRRYGAFLIEADVRELHGRSRGDEPTARRPIADDRRRERGRQAGRRRSVDGQARRGLPDAVAHARDLLARRSPTGAGPSRRCPGYIESHVHRERLDARARRVRAAADLPAADADPHARGQREVA